MSDILKIAHRGYSELYPENTMVAFEKAISAGADMIELDVHLTKDNELVVIHDDYIDRTSDGSGMVKDFTLSQLKKYNYNNGNSVHTDVEIPTLKDVVALVKGKIELNIEIKNCPNQYENIVNIIASLLKEMQFCDDVIISSFDHYALKDMKDVLPLVRRGLLYDAIWLTFKDEVKLLDVFSLHPGVDTVAVNHLAEIEKMGLQVYPWVARDKITVDRLVATGNIHGIIVNDLKLLDSLR